MKGNVYYLTGPDGSGKTTFLQEIKNLLTERRLSVRHIWLRSPKILSKPLMAYCRLVGLTKYTVINGVKYGKHEFYRSKFVSWLFPYLQFMDFKIKWYLERRKIHPEEVLLFDRFALDTLADLMVDTKRDNLINCKIGKKFISTIPLNTKIISLRVDEEIIRSRKVDTLYDEHLSLKIKAYRHISEELELIEVLNNQPIEVVKREIFIKLGL
ncbi:MAG TPA: hypothetical protein PKH45_10435 [Tenuifilaceae bacterium]|jgi:thymidylate kinase|nr:hypothetical protein [Tenuifilaceae bacterium]